MGIKKITEKELEIKISINKSTEEIEPKPSFPEQKRVEKAFEVAINTEKEGYNLYVAGPDGVGKTTYSLIKFKESAKNKRTPEDICYYHNFEKPENPKCLLLPAGYGKKLSNDINKIIENLKETVYKQFESKEFEDEEVKIIKEIEDKRRKIIEQLTEDAKKHGLAVVFTPAGIKLFPIIEGKVIPDFVNIPQIRDIYNKRIEEFDEKFRDYLRQLRELDYQLFEKLKKVKEQISNFIIENAFYFIEEKYKEIEEASKFIKYIKGKFVENIEIFIRLKLAEGNYVLQRALERDLNIFKLNVVVDNSDSKGAPVKLEGIPTFKTLFGYISYKAEMGILYADHMSIIAGSLHKSRGGYLLLKAIDVIKNPILWDALKRTLLHKKIYMTQTSFDGFFPFSVGINPEPVPFDIKLALIGDSFVYSILSTYDTEFNRLFKVKAEFNPIIKLSNNVIEDLSHAISKIVKEENLKHLSPDGISEVFKHAVVLSGDRNKINVIFSYISDILREANFISGEKKYIDKKDIQTTIKEKKFRRNLVEEKILELISEGKLIVDVEGKQVGQVNGIAVYDIGDYSFGKPSRITASVYIGEKGIINIEREVELSGPIHSKGVMILSGFIGRKYGRDVPLAISCSIAFEQSYGEVEGDSASAAELISVLSEISNIPVKQNLAITGSIDQHGNIQPVGGIKEKIEGFYYTCKNTKFTGEQGVIVPSRNFSNIILEDEILESISKGEFSIYTVDNIDDCIKLLTGEEPLEFHKKVIQTLEEFYQKVIKHKD